MSKEIIEVVGKIEGISEYRRDEIIKEVSKIVAGGSAQIEVEKYKIDKMIENGLMTERDQETISRNKIIDYAFEIVKNNRFWYFLMFIAFMFNSNNFWKYLTLKLGK